MSELIIALCVIITLLIIVGIIYIDRSLSEVEKEFKEEFKINNHE